MTDHNAFQDLTDAELEQVTGGKKASKKKAPPAYSNKGKVGMSIDKRFQMNIDMKIHMDKEIEWDFEQASPTA